MTTRAGWRLAGVTFGAILVVFLLGPVSSGQAAEFTCVGGDVACLITAIRSANGLGQPVESLDVADRIQSAPSRPSPTPRCARHYGHRGRLGAGPLGAWSMP